MEQSLIDAKFDYLFASIRKIDRSKGKEISGVVVIAAVLGYFATHSIIWALLIALFMWNIRSIPYAIHIRKLKYELSMHALAFPEKAEAAIIREELNSSVEIASRKWWRK